MGVCGLLMEATGSKRSSARGAFLLSIVGGLGGRKGGLGGGMSVLGLS